MGDREFLALSLEKESECFFFAIRQLKLQLSEMLYMPDFFQDNYVVIYELLDEMLDNGFPLATESNILKELIKPPNILRTVVNTVTGKTK